FNAMRMNKGQVGGRKMHGSNETVAKLARFMCGRAIKPVRLPRRTTELLRLRHSDYVTCDGPMETVAKPARFMCGRAIKPVRPPGGTIELFKAQPSEHVIGDGSDDP